MGRIISSETLGREPVPLGDQVSELDIYDGLRTPITEDAIELSNRHAEQLVTYAHRASSAFGDADGNKEQTKSQTEFNQPSLLVRIDATINDGDIVAYEMEDSPSGQGITDKIHKAVAGIGIRDVILDHYGALLGDTPMVIVSGARSHGTDDVIIVGGSRYIFDKDGDAKISANDAVIVKAIPGIPTSHEPYLVMQKQATAPLVTEGDKSYLERIGSLKRAACDQDLLVDEEGALVSQAVKSRLGSMAMGVTLYLTNEDKRRFSRAGTVTASKLRTRRREYEESRGGAFTQPFSAPILLDNKEDRSNAILRIFTLLGPEGNANVIGGCYVARPGMVVHGSTDAISGAVFYNGDKQP